MFIKIKKTIKKYIKKKKKKKKKKYKNKTNDTELEVFNILRKEWEKEIDQQIQENTILYDYDKNTLTIKTPTPTWRTEISTQKRDIKEKLNKNIKIKIKNIIVK